MQTLQQVENYTALSERASEYLLAVIRSKPNAVICLATGATPLLTYHYLVEKIHQQQVDVSQLTFVKLDSPWFCQKVEVSVTSGSITTMYFSLLRQLTTLFLSGKDATGLKPWQK